MLLPHLSASSAQVIVWWHPCPCLATATTLSPRWGLDVGIIRYAPAPWALNDGAGICGASKDLHFPQEYPHTQGTMTLQPIETIIIVQKKRLPKERSFFSLAFWTRNPTFSFCTYWANYVICTCWCLGMLSFAYIDHFLVLTIFSHS